MYKKNKIAAIVSTLLIATSAFATDNSIYIDQSGDLATITMTQDGASNQVKGINGAKDTPAKLYGDNLLVDVQQTGSGNTLSLGAVTGTAGGIGSTIIYHVTGNSATAVIDMNNNGSTPSLANYINVNQVGDTANTNISMKGSGNQMQVVQTGGNNNSFVAQVEAGATVVATIQPHWICPATKVKLTSPQLAQAILSQSRKKVLLV
jgi:hypothetical protein